MFNRSKLETNSSSNQYSNASLSDSAFQLHLGNNAARSNATILQMMNVIFETKAGGQIVQKAEGYLEDLKETNRWGGEPEAHAIASAFGFTTRIYRNLGDMNNPMTYTTVGNGRKPPYYLYWDGAHYVVVNKKGRIIHDPVGDGNCMFEAVYFILKGRIAHRLLRSENIRIAAVRSMRVTAANWMLTQPELLDILEDEYAQEKEIKKQSQEEFPSNLNLQTLMFLEHAYKTFPPKSFHIHATSKSHYFADRETNQNASTGNVDHFIISYCKKQNISDEIVKKLFRERLMKTFVYKPESIPEDDFLTKYAKSDAAVFARSHPKAIWIPPGESIKKCLRGTPFQTHQNFVTGAFQKQSPTLPRCDGHILYHDTQGGTQGGFTVFGIIIGDHQFVIAYGKHSRTSSGKKTTDQYKIEWSAVSGVWGEGKTVEYNVT